MISLSAFKDNLLALFRVMTANNGMYIDVVYKGRLYRITVEDLNQKVSLKRRARHRDLSDAIQARKCPLCKKVMINSVCMNSKCPGRAGAVLT